jgi:hypothetical protein
MADYYLPELTPFEYKAVIPWHRIGCKEQQDWIETITTLEAWLEQYTGPHWVEWAYSQHCDQGCVAFRRDRNRTLFLLTWS